MGVMQSGISIKPHHFVDIITSFGKGKWTFKPHPFGHAVHVISQDILANRDVLLKIELGIDDICKPCKHNKNGICDDTIDTSHRPEAPSSKNEWNLLIDLRWCDRLNIKQDDLFTAREFCEMIRDNKRDITDIYRKIPVSLTAERNVNLVKGIECYLV